ncbi:MAG: M24 family metallopeptidase, partial [Deltaproteobacteria bacterium]|nr:M24 family metallopeptidase [Deltaproteobacteria bacterium]
MQALIKTADQIKGIKKACRLASRVLDEVGYLVAEGISTETLDKFIHDFIVKHNGIPATLNYKGYPKSCCISRNDVICHGIPRDDEILQNGDIVNIDVTVILDGYFGDTSRMYCVGGIGSISSTARRLVEVTEAALYQGIKVVRNGG